MGAITLTQDKILAMGSATRGVTLALQLANTIDLLEDLPDLLRDVDRFVRFLRRVGYDGAREATDRDLARVRKLRSRITDAMDADEVTAAAILAPLAESLDTRPRLVPRRGGGWELRYGPSPEQGASALAASVVVGLMQLMAEGQWDRIGRCTGAPCCCFFVDRTRNRNRRFCCQLCADRTNQARARARRRTI
jgi:predicted RNA-binding Zn ribbon-like protein